MALRVVEVVLPAREAETLGGLVEAAPRGGPWRQTLEGGLVSARYVVDTDDVSELVDDVQRRFGNVKGFALVIQPATAALPKPPEPEKEPEKPKEPRRFGSKRGGLTREELETDAHKTAAPSGVFYASVVLSTIVVAIGLMKNNAAVIIGAMVIAPLLGPNVALALSTTLGDTKLMRKSFVSSISGITVALIMSILVGAMFDHIVVEDIDEIMGRTSVDPSDIILALAAGSAGALAMTTGVSSALVGVMVAVALLPPTTVVGIMLAHGKNDLAGQALLLLCVNVIGVNLAATATFLVQGIQPRTWWEADRARRATLIALGIGSALIVALVVFFWLGSRSR